MRVADGTDIFRPVYPTSYASPLFPHSETNFQFDFIHKTFYLSPQYKRHKAGFHCVGLRVTSYEVPRGRNERSLKHDNGRFHKRVHIKRPSLQRRLGSSVGIVMRLRIVHSRQQKSIGLKFSKSQTGSDVRYTAIIIRVVLISPYLRIRAVSLSSIHYNQSHRVYINRRRQYICLI